MSVACRKFVSIDRAYRCETNYAQPDRYRELERFICQNRNIAVRGAGLSYVAASFSKNSTSLVMTNFNRILRFDVDAMCIEVECGISLGKLYEFLLPYSLVLPIQPGHPQITVGGCIAANIHGKNQPREGLFIECVESIVIIHPDYGQIVSSRTENADIFALTCGGLGLTGVIVSARLRLSRLPARAVKVSYEPFGSLAEGFALIDALELTADLIYGWVDLSHARRWGYGYVVCGQFVDQEKSDTKSLHWKDMDPSAPSWQRFPVFNPLTMPFVNIWYSWSSRRQQRIPLYEFLFRVIGKEFYYNLYGEKGFIEQQNLIPTAAISSYLSEFEKISRKTKIPIALGTMKGFRGEDRYLDFNGTGISFCIDVFNNDKMRLLLSELDVLNIEHGAKTNLMKDSRLPGHVARRQYPEFDAFRHALLRFDPARRFHSELSERIGL